MVHIDFEQLVICNGIQDKMEFIIVQFIFKYVVFLNM